MSPSFLRAGVGVSLWRSPRASSGSVSAFPPHAPLSLLLLHHGSQTVSVSVPPDPPPTGPNAILATSLCLPLPPSTSLRLPPPPFASLHLPPPPFASLYLRLPPSTSLRLSPPPSTSLLFPPPPASPQGHTAVLCGFKKKKKKPVVVFCFSWGGGSRE